MYKVLNGHIMDDNTKLRLKSVRRKSVLRVYGVTKSVLRVLRMKLEETTGCFWDLLAFRLYREVVIDKKNKFFS